MSVHADSILRNCVAACETSNASQPVLLWVISPTLRDGKGDPRKFCSVARGRR